MKGRLVALRKFCITSPKFSYLLFLQFPSSGGQPYWVAPFNSCSFKSGPKIAGALSHTQKWSSF